MEHNRTEKSLEQRVYKLQSDVSDIRTAVDVINSRLDGFIHEVMGFMTDTDYNLYNINEVIEDGK